MTIQQKIKKVLIDLALNDKLPLDLTTLDESIFDSIFEPVIKSGFVIMHQEGNQECISWWEENNKTRYPVIFEYKSKAEDTIVEDKMYQMQEYFNQERSFDEIDFECDEWVIEIIIEDNKTIINKETGKILFDPNN